MPTLGRFVRGSLVITSGSVMNGPPSSGHVVRIGSLVRSGVFMTTSCTLPSRTVLGIALASGARRISAAAFSTSDAPGGENSISERTRVATSSRRPASSAIAMRRCVPNWFVSTGNFEPLTSVNSSAGPPALTTRSVISAISRRGSTCAPISHSSPALRSASTKARNESYGTGEWYAFGRTVSAVGPANLSVCKS